MEEQKYFCFSCDGEITKEEIEKAKKKNKYSGLCSWCRELNRSLNSRREKE